MNIKLKKILRYTAWSFVVFLCVYIYLLLFPQILFKYRITYRNFNIYSNENIQDRIPAIIDSSINSLKISEIYDPELTQKVFFIHDSFYCILTLPYYKSRSAFHEFLINNTMIVRPPMNISTHNVKSKVYDNILSCSITHEVVHSLECNRLGFWKAVKAPAWKIEGYAFFIQYHDKVVKGSHMKPDFVRGNFRSRRDKNMNQSYSSFALLVGYLLMEKQLTFDQLMMDDITSENTLTQMEQWYKQNYFDYERADENTE